MNYDEELPEWETEDETVPEHLERKWIDAIVNWMEHIVRNHRLAVYSTTVVLIIVSMIGIYMIRVSGSLIEDMPKGKEFFKDIVFFEK